MSLLHPNTKPHARVTLSLGHPSLWGLPNPRFGVYRTLCLWVYRTHGQLGSHCGIGFPCFAGWATMNENATKTSSTSFFILNVLSFTNVGTVSLGTILSGPIPDR